jgi:hypothetical protein
MIKRFFKMLREWMRGPVKQPAAPRQVEIPTALQGFSIGE